LVENILESLRSSYLFYSALNATDGIKIAFAEIPDLILMDIDMPILDGYEAFKILKKIPETQYIPIIAFSANTGEEDIEDAINLGFSSYLTKPIDIPVFLESIDLALGNDRTKIGSLPVNG
jgi:CheY-like chemotaxis protein